MIPPSIDKELFVTLELKKSRSVITVGVSTQSLGDALKVGPPLGLVLGDALKLGTLLGPVLGTALRLGLEVGLELGDALKLGRLLGPVLGTALRLGLEVGLVLGDALKLGLECAWDSTKTWIRSWIDTG